MKEPIIIKLKDLDTSDEALAIVRYDEVSVAVGLSLKSSGDTQVVMNKADAGKLVDALKKATSQE